jgi:uncharacterized membrane protein YebE (DUF533 family)
MLRKSNMIAVGLLTAFIGTTTLTAPMAARASEEGKRNTTLGLGAAAAALLLTQKNKLPGALVGAGAVYAYTQYNNDINKRHKRERLSAYRSGYRRGATYTRATRRSRRG